MKLSELAKAVDPQKIYSLQTERRAWRQPDPANLPVREIKTIHYRAQEVQPDGMFVAIEGQTADGHDYIGQALGNGAAVIVVQKNPGQSFVPGDLAGAGDKNPVIIQVPDTRMALADLAACFYHNPSENLYLIGITGTNGKTTVAYLIESIWLAAGFQVGVIGTINYRYANKVFPNPMTTPESLDLHRILSEMLQAGVTHVVMEASSHAMDQYRIRGCRFDAAVFTNLSQDHLDYHGDMQSYWSSKKRLFTEYLIHESPKNNLAAIINCDDPRGRELADVLSVNVIKTGSAPEFDIKAETSRYELVGTNGRLSIPQGSFDFKTPLVGTHNLENILSASGAAAATNIAPETIKAGIESLAAIPSRLESIENSSGRFVYVDYAHTPDALNNAVSALKAIAPARIICVFGCGGDRDQEKRPMMGEIAGRLSDLAVVTSDNPRSEEPAAIIDQILPGVTRSAERRYTSEELQIGFEQKGYTVEPDRRRAIGLAIKASEPNDAVLIAGKGHETYQIIGNETIDFDDREEARKALAKLNHE